mmetsp:Transcript_26373/g.55127  ORF Transcript_26373/g.55127 Transcript_26373/m.55127 type:complete len:303 (-) Transcript_26373:105-1013(-)
MTANTSRSARARMARDSIRVVSHPRSKVPQEDDHQSSSAAAAKVQSLLADFDDIVQEEKTSQGPEATSPHEPSTSSQKKSVSFSTAHYHVHATAMGDNPACLEGYPLTIDWKRLSTTLVDLTLHPHDHPSAPEQVPKRSYTDLRLSARERERVLRAAGYTKAQLVQLGRPVNIDRARRSRTMETMSLHPLQDALKRASKSLSKSLCTNKTELQRRAYYKEWRSGQGPVVEREFWTGEKSSSTTSLRSSTAAPTKTKKVQKAKAHSMSHTATSPLDATNSTIRTTTLMDGDDSASIVSSPVFS